MAGRPSACLLRNPLADELSTGTPANFLAGPAGRSGTVITGSAAASVGSARPAAAAAPAPRKSRRVGDTNTPMPGYGCEIRPEWAPSKACGTLRRMSATIRDQLRQAHFLEGVTESLLHQLAKLVQAQTFETDAILFHEGSPRELMAILTSGAIAIEKTMNGRPVRLVTLGAGEAVGEGVLLDDSRHGTSARALQRTDAFVLTADQLKSTIKDHPALYAALVGRAARAISQRLA